MKNFDFINKNIFINQLKEKFPSLNNIEELSYGGQKIVYKADHIEYGKIVLKIIKPNPKNFDRTYREIRATKILKSNNIPIIYESNVDDKNNKEFWIIEEFIEGKDLREYLNCGYKFKLSEIVNFINTLLNLSIIIENNELVHRDIKPENIIYNVDDKKFWLIDFGLARHLDLESITDTNEPFGLCTWGYAASEQFRNFKKDINIRADLFSIGVVAFELITGYNPFRKGATDIFHVIRNIEKVPLPMLRIPGDTQYLLATFIKTIGDNRLSRRPKSAKEALDIFNSIKTTLKF